MAIEAGMLLYRYILSILFYCRDTPLQGDFNCSSLPAGLGGNGEFERKFEEILREFERKLFRMKSAWEEVPQLKSPCSTVNIK